MQWHDVGCSGAHGYTAGMQILGSATTLQVSNLEAALTLGANIVLEPTDEPYGMRDFVVGDPDGNLLTFGRGLSPAAAP